DDVAHESCRHLSWRRSEDETHGTGAHGHREERVFLARDAADLDEHPSRLLADVCRDRPQIGHCRDWIGGTNEALAYENGVVTGVGERLRVVGRTDAGLCDAHHTI